MFWSLMGVIREGASEGVGIHQNSCRNNHENKHVNKFSFGVFTN